MSKSIKLKDNVYLDSTGVVHNRELLSDILNRDNHARVKIFSGSASSGSVITINTTWQALGKFKKLIVQINHTSWNSFITCEFNYEDLTTGDNLYNGKRNSNVYSNVSYAGDSNVHLHLIPNSFITNNTIKFDEFSYKITNIWVEY